MPGNRALYEQSMAQAEEAARQEDWPRALKEALRAINEFPRDLPARVFVASGLFHTGKPDKALHIFQELRGAEPENSQHLEYILKIKRQLGQTDDLLSQLVELSNLHVAEELYPQAIDDLREALQLDPDHEEARIRLATLLTQVGDRRNAIREYVTIGERYISLGDFEGAQAALDEMLAIDENSRDALQFQSKLQKAMDDATQAEEDEILAGMPVDVPLDEDRIPDVLHTAASLQSNGDLRGAIAQYERVIGVAPQRGDANFNLGLIYAELGNADKAITHFERAAADDEYALSAHFELGNLLHNQEDYERAAQEFEQTLRLVDLQSIGRDESGDLIAMYEATAASYERLGDLARVASLYATLAGFLQGKRWGREQAEAYNRKAKEYGERNMFSKLRTIGTGMLQGEPPPEPEPEQEKPQAWGKLPSITDFLRPQQAEEPAAAPAPAEPDIFQSFAAQAASPLDDLPPIVAEVQFPPVTPLDAKGRSEIVQRYVDASGRYVEQGLLYAALDACHEVVRHDIEFYPIHIRLGEIYERLGWRDKAIDKYQILLSTFEARGEDVGAISVYFRLVELSPDSTSARIRLAELLFSEGRREDAALQMVAVANAHYAMGQTNKALEEFRRAIQWAPENDSIRSEYGMLLLKLERWEAAVAEFRRAVELNASDPIALARLNLALALFNEYPAAVWDSLITLAGLLQKQPEVMDKVAAEYRAAMLIADHAILHYLLGATEFAAGRASYAVLELEQALQLLELEPDDMLPELLVRQVLAESYIATNEAERAIAELQKCEGLMVISRTKGEMPTVKDPALAKLVLPITSGELQRNLAEAYAAGGDIQGAISALQEVKRLLPYDRAAYTKLADLYFRAGRLQEALAQLEDLATYYEGQQQLNAAIEILESATTLAPSNVPVRKRLAHLFIRRGYLDEGLSALQELAELQRSQGLIKDAVQSLQSAAEVYWTLGKHDMLYEIYDRIVHIAPNDTEARSHLVNFYIQSFRLKDAIREQKQIARIFMQQRNYQEAIGAYHQVIALDPNDVETYEHFGEVLMRVGEFGQALRIYKRLARLAPNDDRVEALIAAAQRMIDQAQPSAPSAPSTPAEE